uniref:YceI family protein n=1 Tax=Roseivirga sp. TaxID=1964215 RepID=UPI004047B2B7
MAKLLFNLNRPSSKKNPSSFKALFGTKESVKEANQYFILGKLTIKGTTKNLKIPLKVIDNSFEVEFELNRRDYDVGGNSFILSDEVNIKLKLAK